MSKESKQWAKDNGMKDGDWVTFSPYIAIQSAIDYANQQEAPQEWKNEFIERSQKHYSKHPEGTGLYKDYSDGDHLYISVMCKGKLLDIPSQMIRKL